MKRPFPASSTSDAFANNTNACIHGLHGHQHHNKKTSLNHRGMRPFYVISSAQIKDWWSPSDIHVACHLIAWTSSVCAMPTRLKVVYLSRLLLSNCSSIPVRIRMYFSLLHETGVYACFRLTARPTLCSNHFMYRICL